MLILIILIMRVLGSRFQLDTRVIHLVIAAAVRVKKHSLVMHIYGLGFDKEAEVANRESMLFYLLSKIKNDRKEMLTCNFQVQLIL
jgi:hypothetical protein